MDREYLTWGLRPHNPRRAASALRADDSGSRPRRRAELRYTCFNSASLLRVKARSSHAADDSGSRPRRRAELRATALASSALRWRRTAHSAVISPLTTTCFSFVLCGCKRTNRAVWA